MTKKEIMTALDKLGVEYKKKSKKSVLATLLSERAAAAPFEKPLSEMNHFERRAARRS